MLVTGLLAGTIAWRARRAAWALVPVAVAFVAVILLGTVIAAYPVAQGLVLGGVGLLWAGWRVTAARLGAHQITTEASRAATRRLWWHRVRTGAAMLVVGASRRRSRPRAPARRPAHGLARDGRPPLDLHQYVSPLTAFRKYARTCARTSCSPCGACPRARRSASPRSTRTTASSTTSRAGCPARASTRVRARRSRRSRPARRRASTSRSATTPGCGCPTPASSRASPTPASGRASSATRRTTTRRPARRCRPPGCARATPTRSTRSSRPSRPRTTSARGDRPVRAGPHPAEGRAARVARGQGRAVHGRGDRAGRPALRAARRPRRERHLLESGLDTQPPSRPGHSAERIDTLLADEEMVGDDEQFAVALALMANQAGIPARVVMGFYPDLRRTRSSRASRTPRPGPTCTRGPRCRSSGTAGCRSRRSRTRTTRSSRSRRASRCPSPDPRGPGAAGGARRGRGREDRRRGEGEGRQRRVRLGPGRPHRRRRGRAPRAARAADRARARLQGAAPGPAPHRGTARRPRERRLARGARRRDRPRDARPRRLDTPRGRGVLAQAYGATATIPLAHRADATVFGTGEPTEQEIEAFWADVDSVVGGLRSSVNRRARVRAALSLRSVRAGGGSAGLRRWLPGRRAGARVAPCRRRQGRRRGRRDDRETSHERRDVPRLRVRAVPGAAFCAVCGQPFPRTGRPVAAPSSGPVGGVQAVAGRGAPVARSCRTPPSRKRPRTRRPSPRSTRRRRRPSPRSRPGRRRRPSRPRRSRGPGAASSRTSSTWPCRPSWRSWCSWPASRSWARRWAACRR